MPVHARKDAKGCYCQWGSQKKYYYECGNDKDKGRAWAKAAAQGKKIESTGWTENEGETRMFQYVTANIKPTVRNDMMEGKEWLVCPTVMMTEGVHDGSGGPIYYPSEELNKLPVVWNHKPVVVYHPQKNGVMMSACDPVELTSRKVGVLMNTNFDVDSKKLKTESWLDPERIGTVDNRIAEAIANNEMMEVSTGLYMDLEKTEGEWNGKEYIGIARNIQPDHLALLPDLKGACSIEDGAGFLRVNQTDESMLVVDEAKPNGCVWISREKGIGALPSEKKGPVSTFVFNKQKWTSDDAKNWATRHKGMSLGTLILNEMGHESIRRLLSSQLREKDDNAWIEEVYDDFFIYENDGKLYRQSYSTIDGKVAITGDPEEVVKVIEYRRADGSFVGNVTNAEWTTKYINDLPDSAFLYIEGGGKKDAAGKTKPRSLRHFPFKDKNGRVDLPHLRNALARIPQSNVPDAVKKRCTARAKSILKKFKKVSSQSSKGKNMDEKEKIVNALIENENTKWTEDDRDELMALSESMLTNMAELIKDPVGNETDDVKDKKPDEKPGEKSADETVTNEPKKPKTVEEYMANADIPQEVRESIQAGMDSLKGEKDRLIGIITANEHNVFTKENLETKPVHELKALALLAAKEKHEVENTIPLYDYTGQGQTPDVTQNKEKPYIRPTMNFGEQKATG